MVACSIARTFGISFKAFLVAITVPTTPTVAAVGTSHISGAAARTAVHCGRAPGATVKAATSMEDDRNARPRVSLLKMDGIESGYVGANLVHETSIEGNHQDEV